MGYTHIELAGDGAPVLRLVGYHAPVLRPSRAPAAGDFKAFGRRATEWDSVSLDGCRGFPMDPTGRALDGTGCTSTQPTEGGHREWATLISLTGARGPQLAAVERAVLARRITSPACASTPSRRFVPRFSRSPGLGPNKFGGRENIEAIDFLRELNTLTHGEHPGSIMVAEESTSFPGVTRPTHLGGLGFTYKWNMGWMNDTLAYIKQDPLFRRYHHRLLTFSLMYAFSENYILPFSHDEVVHLKGSMWAKPPGDEWQRAATLRAVYGYMSRTRGRS